MYGSHTHTQKNPKEDCKENTIKNQRKIKTKSQRCLLHESQKGAAEKELRQGAESSLSLSLSYRVPAKDGDNGDQNVRIQETTAVEYLYAYLQ